MSIRIVLLMAVKFPSSDSSQAVGKAFDAARSAQQLMDSLNLSLGALAILPQPLLVIIVIRFLLAMSLRKLC